MKTALFESLAEVWSRFSGKVLYLLPRLMAALLVVAVGWALAALVRAVVKRGLRLARFDARCERSGLALVLRRADLPWTPTEALSRCAFWLVMASAVILSMSALELPLFDRMVAEFFLYLPRAFVALVILAVGFLAANFLSRGVLLLAVNADLPGPRVASGTVRVLVGMLTFAMALEQLGIARNIVTVAFAIAFGAFMLGLALSFGLGGRDLARDLLARRFKPETAEREDGLHHL